MECGAIEINGLKVQSNVGVTDIERSHPQDISFDIRIRKEIIYGWGVEVD